MDGIILLLPILLVLNNIEDLLTFLLVIAMHRYLKTVVPKNENCFLGKLEVSQ